MRKSATVPPNRSSSAGTVPHIASRLARQRVLVTGATGFLAKAFVEKLLRSVPDLGALYLLVRPGADGLSARARVDRDVFANRAFDRLRALMGPGFQQLCNEKVHVLSGDLTQDFLGLPPEAYAELTKNLTVIVNSAATVTFDERLDWAVELNTLGPRRLLRLAQECGNIPFLHVSTCYVCGTRQGVIVEDFSAPECARETLPHNRESGSFDLDAVLAELTSTAAEVIAKSGSDAEIRRQALIQAGMDSAQRHGWNDTYTFTKWLGEQMLVRDRGSVPLVVFRPAIIEGSWDEPQPGWIDGLRMADPIVVAYGRGKLREFPGRPDTVIDFIPVDFVVNGMCAALPVGTPPDWPAVVQCASSDRKPLHMRDLVTALQKAFHLRPMADEHGKPVLPGRLRLVELGSFVAAWQATQRRLERSARWLQKLGMGEWRVRKQRALLRQIDQILYFAKIYAPYTNQNRSFADDNLRSLAERIPAEDRAEFPFLADGIDWEDYVVNRHVPGVRSFVLGGSAEVGVLSNTQVKATVGEDEGPLRGSTLFEMFRIACEKWPEKPALQIQRSGRWVRYRYGEALHATGSITQRFAEYGLKPGDCVAISSENGPEWGLVYFAAMRAGLTAVPLDPQLPPRDAWEAIRFVQGKLVCAGSTTLAGLTQARSSQDAPLVALAEPFIPPPGASRDRLPENVPTTGQSIASILFTSGTTVSPRAVPLTHANLLSNAQALKLVHPIHPTDEFLSVLPLYHVFEFMAGLVVPVASGATLTYVEQLKGPDILEAMQSTGTTIMLVVPRLLQMFHDSLERQISQAPATTRLLFQWMSAINTLTRRKLARKLFNRIHQKFGGRLRMFVSGGSRLDPQLLDAFQTLGFTVYEGYGMTETSPVLTVSPPGISKGGSVGLTLPSVELEIRNQNHDGIGEVWVRGPGVMRGYLHNESATQDILVDGWLRTGDLGRQDEQGFLFLTGRSKDLIVTPAGKNVYPDELEVHYRELPYTKELCVVGMPTTNGQGDEVHAVVSLDPESTRDLDRSSVEREIRISAAEVSERLPTHQRIGTFHFWDRELPKTSTLKAKRGLIREQLLAGVTPVHAPPARPSKSTAIPNEGKPEPLDAPEFSVLRDALAKISKRPAHRIHADMHLLLDLGIDSIGKIDLLSTVESQFGLRIDDEAGAKIARVGDLVTLIGSRTPNQPKSNGPAGWRRWLGTPTHPKANGHHDASLQPMRFLLRGFGSALMHSYLRVRARGLEHIPLHGPFIIAANHASHLDAPAVLVALGNRRRVWVAAAEDYFFNSPAKRLVFGRLFDAIAFDRQADGLAGLRRCAEALDRGDGLLIFPEGTRTMSGRMQPFKMGVAALAIERQTPIVPVFIGNAYTLLPKGSRIPKPGVLDVRFGAPILPPPDASPHEPYALFQELTRKIENSVAQLSKQVVG